MADFFTALKLFALLVSWPIGMVLIIAGLLSDDAKSTKWLIIGVFLVISFKLAGIRNDANG